MRKGFTLVELSIVLVIIGLLIGGILVGQSLIDSAKINAQIRQLKQYDIAISLFKNKYKKLPGDASIGIGCAGDEDGNVYASNLTGEHECMWHQLSQSKMINEIYIYSGTPNFSHGQGKNFPLAAISDKAGILTVGDLNSNIWHLLGVNENGIDSHNQNFGHSTGDMMTSAQALSLDTKLDDGLPSSGDVATFRDWNWPRNGYLMRLDISGCPVNGSTNQYNLSAEGNVCKLQIKSQYR